MYKPLIRSSTQSEEGGSPISALRIDSIEKKQGVNMLVLLPRNFGRSLIDVVNCRNRPCMPFAVV